MAEVILQKVTHELNNLYDLQSSCKNQSLMYVLISTQQSKIRQEIFHVLGLVL